MNSNKKIAIREAESNPDNRELKVSQSDVRIYDKNSEAYVVFVPVLDEYDAGYTDVIWVNAKTGEAKHIDGVQEEFPGMYDISTGKILYNNKNTDSYEGYWDTMDYTGDDPLEVSLEVAEYSSDSATFGITLV